MLLDRIHAKIGRVVSHAHAIHVTEHQGRVVLSGPVLASEVRDLLRAVRGIHGVESVENRLDVHDTAAMPALRGGSPRAAGARGSAASARF
jgi:hypothetical protein